MLSTDILRHCRSCRRRSSNANVISLCKLQRDQRIFLFGTGHSHLLAEEGFYRAGGLANVVPILSEHVMLHSLPALGSRLERTPDLADMILERYAPESEEMLFVFSNSG